MADAAEELPLPDEEPVDESPQKDDSSGKDVSFGTFLTVGPKQFRNVTVVGFDSLRNSVRVVRRSGDSVENIQIPYEQYKSIIAEQKESDKATGRRPQKNLSKAVRGYFGKSVSLDGKSSQIIGYDAQNDEVLVNDGASRRWMKSGEMLRSTQNLSSTAPLAAVPSAKASTPTTRTIQDQGGKIDADKTAQIQRAFEQGRVTVVDPPGQRTVGLSIDTDGKVLRQVELTGKTIQPSSINYVSSNGKSQELTDIKIALPAISAPLSAETTVTIETKSSSAGTSAPVSIRETRAELKASRSSGGASVQNAAAAVATVAAAIPASSNAAAVVAAAQKVLAAYGASAETRQNQIKQLTGQISNASNRIDALQQRAKQSRGSGKTTEAAQIEQQIIEVQTERRSLQNQQTDAQVARINEETRAGEIVEAVQRFVPDADGMVPEEQVTQVQKLLPTLAAVPSPTAPNAAAAAALPRPKPAAPPRTYAPGLPSRGTSRTASPSVRTPKPIRPLGGSLSSIGGQARRAVDFGAAQARDRGAELEDSMLSDSSEEALATEGGRPGYSGPLDLPEQRPKSYTTDVEPEEADIYGAQEEASRAEMRRINTGQEGAQPEDQFGLPQQPMEGPTRGSVSIPEEEPMQTGPTPEEITRATALSQGTAQDVQRQNLQQQKKDTSAKALAAQAENQKKQIATAKKTISNLIDAFDAVHGVADVIGLLMTFAHLNLRLALTPFERDLPFLPRAGFPYECTVIGCFDLIVCLSALSMMMGPIIILAAIIATVSGATFGLSELVDLF